MTPLSSPAVRLVFSLTLFQTSYFDLAFDTFLFICTIFLDIVCCLLLDQNGVSHLYSIRVCKLCLFYSFLTLHSLSCLSNTY